VHVLLDYRRQEHARRSPSPGGAHLDVELRLDPSDPVATAVVVVIRNLGPNDAKDVVVEGRVATGHYRRLAKLRVVPAAPEQVLAVPAGYDVGTGTGTGTGTGIGTEHLDVRLGWHDGDGVHPAEHRLVATRRVP
jgi:hypothetical protein